MRRSTSPRRRAGADRGRTTAGPASRASTPTPTRATHGAPRRPATSSRCSSARTAARSARSPAATWSATRGCRRLRGRYLYGDFCGPSLRSVNLADPSSDGDTGLAFNSVASFGEDVCGRLYAASLDGSVSRIEDGAATPCAVDPPPPGTTPTPPPATGAPGDTRKPGVRVKVSGRRSLVSKRRLRVAVTDERARDRAGERAAARGRALPAPRAARCARTGARC